MKTESMKANGWMAAGLTPENRASALAQHIQGQLIGSSWGVPTYDGDAVKFIIQEAIEAAVRDATDNAVPDLLAALQSMVLMFEAVGKKINWSKSFLGADEVRLMNEATLAAARAITNTQGGR